MRQRRRAPKDDGMTTFMVALILAASAFVLWSTPVAAAPGLGGGLGFAPSGAMAAVMGVFLAVALKRRAG